MLRYKIKIGLSSFLIMFCTLYFAQEIPKDSVLQTNLKDTTIKRLQVYESFDVPMNFNREYRYYLSRVKRVYPLALYAADIIDSLENELSKTDKKRFQKRATKETHKDLKDNFKYVVKDLYVSEGKVLTKLIYRETGMTVREIINKYKSGFSAVAYNTMAKLFDQDLDAVYYPSNEDFVIECIIQDIKNGKIDFDPNFKTMNKTEFKEIKQSERAEQKQNKKDQRRLKRELRKKTEQRAEKLIE